MKLQKAFFFFAFLIIYFLFRSAQYDVNQGLVLEQGSLYSANHILFLPIANVFYRVAQAAGYSGRSIYILQILNIFCGAAGVVISFHAFRKLGAATWAALAASLLLGTSLDYWNFSTDETYIVLAGVFTVASLLYSAVLFEKPSMVASFSTGLFFGLATLTWQAAV